MADQYNSAHTGAEIDQAVSDVQNNKAAWSSKPQPSDTKPKAPGTADAGSESAYARGDHVHPSDDTKLSLSGGTMTGIINLNKNVLNLGADTGGHQTYLSLENDDYAYMGGAYVAFRNNSQSQNKIPNAVAVQVRATIQANSSPYFSDVFYWGPAVSVADLPKILGRYYPVNKADTNYTTLMARGESLNAAEVTPAVNGAIAWVYG